MSRIVRSRVMATVVSHQPGAPYFITDTGALALSKDLGPTHISNDMDIGIVFEDYERKRLHPHVHMKILSQEHGKVMISKRERVVTTSRSATRSGSSSTIPA